MAFTDDSSAPSKAERKLRLEVAIAEAIDRLDVRSGAPTEWQKAKILHAIDATTRGLFEVAASNLSQVFAENPIGNPWPSPDTDPADLDKVTIATLRRELDRLRALPVQDPPDYL